MPDKATNEAIQEVESAVKALHAANDENEKRRDVLLEEQLERINKTLDKHEGLNQARTLAEANAKAVEKIQDQMDRIEAAANRPGLPGGANDNADADYRAAFDRAIRRPEEDRSPEDRDVLKKRKNALTKSDDSGAGYLAAPPDLQKEIIKDLIETTPMRALATVRTIGGPSLKQPRKTGNGGATRVGEKQPRTNTGDPEYGMFEVTAPELFARMEISMQMLEDQDYDLLAELREDAVEQFAVKEGAEYISGSGANNQAEGILTNSDIATSLGGHASQIEADGLIGMCYDLKTGYSRNATWGFNRKTLGAIRKLKGSDNNYLWQSGLAAGKPNTILDSPYVEMPDLPDIAANTHPVIYGDFRKGYVIVDRVLIMFQVDYTTGADDGLVVFRGRRRTGGGVRQAEAIRKLKIASI